MEINVNRIYNLLQTGSVENQTIEPFLDGGKLVDQKGDLTSDQKASIRAFRQGLFNSLSGMGVDMDVMRVLREKLGVPEGSKVLESPLAARNVKDAIEAVMAQVDARISKILGKNFPRDVQPLIREAVRENSQHEVVRSLLRQNGDTVTNLARLCRLTMQSQAKTAHLWELSYLKGFSYKVGQDIDNVRLVNNYDESAEKIGKKDYDVAFDQEQVKDLKASVTQALSEKTSAGFAEKVIKALDAKLGNDPSYCALLKLLTTDAKDSFLEAVSLLADKNDNKVINQQPKEKPVISEDEKVDIFIRDMTGKWPKNEKVADESIQKWFTKSKADTEETLGRITEFRTVVAACKQEIEGLKASCDKENNALIKKVKSEFLAEVEELQKVSPNATLYQDLCIVRSAAKNKQDVVVEALKNALKQAIQKKCDLTPEKLQSLHSAPKDHLTKKDAFPSANDKDYQNTMLGQDSTMMCYVRSVENAFISKGRLDLLPTFANSTYTFPVKLGKDLRLTVSANEIANLKAWYASHLKTDADKLRIKDSDWAVNLAMAKLAMFNEKKDLVEAEQKKNKPTGAGAVQNKEQVRENKDVVENVAVDDEVKVNMPSDLKFENDKLNSGYGDSKFDYAEYLKRQLITSTGYDDQVSELFGLGNEPINVSVNFDSNLALMAEGNDQGRVKAMPQLENDKIFSKWNVVREWIEGNPGGIVTLNEASSHTVAVTSCYYDGDDDFGFIVRDSLDPTKEQKVKVLDYRYAGERLSGNQYSTLNVHCYVLPNADLPNVEQK